MTRFHLASSLALALAFVSLSPGLAHAGGCTPCADSAECVDMFGAPAFCIQWDDATGGCSGTPIQCCPGQGCSSASGRPSCESEGRCHVIDEDAGVSLPDAAASTDSGTPGTDSGTPGTDSGTAGTDSGTPGVDAGGTGTDAGSSGMDAGTTPGSTGGCGCHVGQRAGAGGWTMLGLVLAAVLRRRR